MYSGPKFTKPTHSYGQAFGGCETPENDPGTDAEVAALFEGPDDEDWNSPEDAVYDDPDWAGKGFSKSGSPE